MYGQTASTPPSPKVMWLSSPPKSATWVTPAITIDSALK